jgi:hypothetical protein
LWGTRLVGVSVDPNRAGIRFELFWTVDAREQFANLTFVNASYSRFEFEQSFEHEVVELVSVEAEDCVLGIRLFGELSNGTFEVVCASYLVNQVNSGHLA